MTHPITVLKQMVRPTGRHRLGQPLLVDEPAGVPVTARGVLPEAELLALLPEPSRPQGAAVAQCFDDCPTCRKATAGVLTKDGWRCGECLQPVTAGGGGRG